MILMMTLMMMMTSTVTLLTRRVPLIVLAHRSYDAFLVIEVTLVTAICRLFGSRGTRLRSLRVLARGTRVAMPGIKVRLFSIRVVLLAAADALLFFSRVLMPAVRALV